MRATEFPRHLLFLAKNTPGFEGFLETVRGTVSPEERAEPNLQRRGQSPYPRAASASVNTSRTTCMST